MGAKVTSPAKECGESYHCPPTPGARSGAGQASVPEELVTAVLDRLAEHGFGDVEEVEAVEEHMTFALPRELRTAGAVGPRQDG